MPGAALVTGAGKRLGAVFARTLATAGYDVAIHCKTVQDEAVALRDELRRMGRTAELVVADLADPQAVAGLVSEAAQAVGPLTVLVNNASLFRPDLLADLRAEDLRAHIEINYTAPLLLIRDFAAQVQTPPGLVVNILDHKIHSPNPDYFSYTAGKFALAAMTEPLQMALMPRVRVCAIAPGLALPSDILTGEAYAARKSEAPFGGGAAPESLAAALRFILDTPAFAGRILTLDGAESYLRRPRDAAFS